MIVQNYVGCDISKQWLADMIAAYVASDGHGKPGVAYLERLII